jgi:hypothetical protein
VQIGDTSIQKGRKSGSEAFHLGVGKDFSMRRCPTGICKAGLQYRANLLLQGVERTYNVRRHIGTSI